MTNRKVQSAAAKTEAMRCAAVPLLTQLEEQVAKLTRLAEENLEQGMLGHYAEATKMRDSAQATLEELRQKLNLPVEGLAKAEKLAEVPRVETLEPKVAQAARCSYTWRGDSCLEVHDEDSCEVELSERQVRCHWPTRTLTLPVAFRLDVQRSQVRRRRRQSLLELRLAAAEETDLGLRDAVVQRGFGWADAFLGGSEADAVRAHVLRLWERGDLREGEVEGGRKQHLRSDRYLFLEEDDPVLLPFTRKLDQLVLSVAKEVEELKDLWLMRGRPMAAVYATPGAHYTPHFDCVGGDNGRKITCVLYLNPFWQPGDGAELQLFPEAHSLTPEGPCHEVEPLHGRLASFLCDSRNLHAVKPLTGAPRLALSCWYYDSEGGQFHREDARDALR